MLCYIATISLREINKPDVLASKTTRIYSDNLPAGESILRVKNIEILRDVQWLASDGKIPHEKLYARRK